MAHQTHPITAYFPPCGQGYEHIPHPTFEQLRQGAYNWHVIAELYKLEYAFVGSIVARFRGDDFQVHTIEILVSPGILDDDARILTQIQNQQPQYLGITSTNRHIIVTNEIRQGIALQFFATGTNNYPYDFIPAYDSPLRSAQHLGFEPTINHMLLRNGPPCPDKTIPFIRSRYLLYQRLSRFNENLQNSEQKEQNWRDMNDIETFLKCTAEDRDIPFPNQVAQNLLQTVRAWINYADSNFHQFTSEAENEWRRLGFDV